MLGIKYMEALPSSNILTTTPRPVMPARQTGMTFASTPAGPDD